MQHFARNNAANEAVYYIPIAVATIRHRKGWTTHEDDLPEGCYTNFMDGFAVYCKALATHQHLIVSP